MPFAADVRGVNHRSIAGEGQASDFRQHGELSHVFTLSVALRVQLIKAGRCGKITIRQAQTLADVRA